MASSNRTITVLLSDSEIKKPEATKEQIEQINKVVENIFARYGINGDDSLIFAAKYFHNPEADELKSLLTAESAESFDQLAQYYYYQNNVEHTIFAKPADAYPNPDVVEEAAYVSLPSAAPAMKK